MQPSAIFTFIPIFYLYIYTILLSTQINLSKLRKYLHYRTETHIKRTHINQYPGTYRVNMKLLLLCKDLNT